MSEASREFDLAFSFAGEDREVVQQLAEILRAEGVKVFYDEFFKGDLWGKDLYQHMQRVYKDGCHYCVVFVSKAYLQKSWAKHELKQAQARAFEQDSEYLLPLRIDDSVLPGLNATVGYLDLRTTPVAEIAKILLAKLGRKPTEFSSSNEAKEKRWTGGFVEYNGMKVRDHWPEMLEQAQYQSSVLVTTAYDRIRHGSERYWGRRKLSTKHVCHDCAALPGQFHVPGCDMEECPSCKGQALACGCAHQDVTSDELQAWEEREE